MFNKRVLLGTSLTFASLATFAADKPNIIFIITDQQSVNTISALKDVTRENDFETPNMDRMVKQGYTFTNSYCANPVSAPSRFVIFTGKYGTPYGVRSNGSKTVNEERIRPMLKNNAMGNVFKEAGYETAYSGKIHLPCSAESGVAMYEEPVAYGFDKYLSDDERGITADLTSDFIKSKTKSDKPFLLVASYINPHDICMENRRKTDGYPKYNNEKLAPRIGMIKGLRAELEAMDYGEFMAKHAPELPYNLENMEGYPRGSKKYTDEYWREYRWLYKELMLKVDAHIGKMLDALDANPEVKKNTIVIFTSDHGEMQGAHRQIAKQVPFDECQKVPLIVIGGGAKANKIDTKTMACGIDIIPTMCELAGIKSKGDFEGVSLAQIVKGKSKSLDRERIFTEGATFLNIMDGDLKYTNYDLAKGEEILVNLKSDPGEMKNLIVTEPDKYRATADRFKKILDEWKEAHK